MRNPYRNAGLVVALTALMTSGAMAQDAGRGDGKGGGKRGNGQTVERDGKGSGNPTAERDGKGRKGSGTTSTATPAPAPVATPASQPSTPSTTYWYDRRGNDRTPGIDRDQAEQAAKITWGQRRGLITDSEARALKAEQDRIADLERRAKADGNVTRDERRSIRTAQRDADRHIRDEAFDRERAGQRGGWGRGWNRGWW